MGLLRNSATRNFVKWLVVIVLILKTINQIYELITETKFLDIPDDNVMD